MKSNQHSRDPLARALVRKEAELKALIEAVQALPLRKPRKQRPPTRIAAKYAG